MSRPRFDPGISDLRRHTTRGTLINSGFHIGLAGLALLQRVAVAAFLTREEFGTWAVVLVALVTLGWLKQLGIIDKYIQQKEPDQELAFQKAFTLELASSVVFFVVAAVALPLYALAYGHPEIVAPGLLLALFVPLAAFETPAWIPYRRMDYVRHRLLASINPVVAFGVTLALGAAGAGYWCFPIGIVTGTVVSGIVCTLTSPYRLRLRADRATVREYASFSWPLVGGGLSNMLVIQGSMLAANRSVGLAGIGAIGLATGVAAFADRVDAIVSQTIYPAVCAVVDRKELLFEVFVKSNRVALMWAMPFGVGLALFADELVRYAFGSRWEPAAGLLAAIGLTAAVGHVAFNWVIFMRAVNDTRPLFVGALVDVAVFATVSVPAILTLGLTGWAIGIAAATLAQLGVKAFYMRRMFPAFNLLGQFARAAAPTLPGAALVLLLRLGLPADPSLARALAEVALYALTTAACTAVLERRLVREMAGYLLGRPAMVGAGAPTP